jgi:hypothetical protein
MQEKFREAMGDIGIGYRCMHTEYKTTGILTGTAGKMLFFNFPKYSSPVTIMRNSKHLLRLPLLAGRTP